MHLGRDRIQRWTLVALPVVIVVVDLVGMIATTTEAAELRLGLGPPGVLLSVAVAAAFLWRRERPVLLFVATTLTVAPGALATHASGALVLAAGYAIGAWSDRLRIGGLLVGAVAVLAGVGLGSEEGVLDGVTAGALVVLPLVVGYALRTRRLYVEEVEARLESAELRREDRARQAVLSERNRIARELHDVVAHHVSLMGVRAGAARTALAADPAAAEAALLAIEDSSRQAVAELRELLGALRDGGEIELGPQPGLGELDALVEGYRGAGLTVTLDVDGDRAAVDPLDGLTAYRVVEEALTNVTRHSSASVAEVHIDVVADRIDVQVRDGGPGRTEPALAGTGSGLVGLRERVLLSGGTVDAGPRGDGFAVEASIPRRRRP
ncbi:MAG: histidine kinase [Actinomycetota bacterium]